MCVHNKGYGSVLAIFFSVSSLTLIGYTFRALLCMWMVGKEYNNRRSCS